MSKHTMVKWWIIDTPLVLIHRVSVTKFTKAKAGKVIQMLLTYLNFKFLFNLSPIGMMLFNKKKVTVEFCAVANGVLCKLF